MQSQEVNWNFEVDKICHRLDTATNSWGPTYICTYACIYDLNRVLKATSVDGFGLFSNNGCDEHASLINALEGKRNGGHEPDIYICFEKYEFTVAKMVGKVKICVLNRLDGRQGGACVAKTEKVLLVGTWYGD